MKIRERRTKDVGNRAISVVAGLLVVFLSCPVFAQNLRRADELGEDFQRQMPYSKDKTQSSETPVQAQPREYTAPAGGEQPSATGIQGNEYPLCYNPLSGVYEYCDPGDSEYFRQRFQSPDFRYWWERGRACPPGYYFRQGWGCYRK